MEKDKQAEEMRQTEENAQPEEIREPEENGKGKKKKAPIPKDQLLPGWLRAILILAPLVLMALEIVLVVLVVKSWKHGVQVAEGLDFTAQSMGLTALVIIVAILIVALFVMQFIFAKVIFKKRVHGGAVVLNAISLLVGLILCIYASGLTGSVQRDGAKDHNKLIGTLEAFEADEMYHFEQENLTALIAYLKENKVERAAKVKGRETNLDDSETTWEDCKKNFDFGYTPSVKNANSTVTYTSQIKYDIFVKNGLEGYLEGKTLEKETITRGNVPRAHNDNYGWYTEIYPETVSVFSLVKTLETENTDTSITTKLVSYNFMIDVEHKAVRIVETNYSVKILLSK